MLLESTKLLRREGEGGTFQDVLTVLSRSTRDTDITGWYKADSTVGVIFTELGSDIDGKSVAGALLTRVSKALSDTLSIEQIHQLTIRFYVFPEKWKDGRPLGDIEAALYDELLHDTPPNRALLDVKRLIDIIGSSSVLLLSLPLLMVIGIAIKSTSRGPVFFRQVRLGQYGRRFTFLKFRSMYANCDHAIHRDYVTQFIAGANGCANPLGSQAQYKLATDPRITPLGHFLRKTSLDEFPQLFNVITGDMSLVGPRPPIPYETASYNTWHRSRVLAAKPGITGLWQVKGRSRVKFDEMVRLDLRYARSWSLWLDVKILLQTPLAVFTGNGAR